MHKTLSGCWYFHLGYLTQVSYSHGHQIIVSLGSFVVEIARLVSRKSWVLCLAKAWHFMLLYLIKWHYSLGWALASSTIQFCSSPHYSILLLSLFVHLSSIYLSLGLPFFLVMKTVAFSIFSGILSSSILCRCQNHLNLCDYINFMMSSP